LAFLEGIAILTQPAATLIALLRQQLMLAPPFSGMHPDHVDQFILGCTETYVAPDEVVIRPEDGPVTTLYYVRQGLVTGVSSPKAVNQPAFQLESGDLFPISAALAGRAVTRVYRATSDTFLLSLPVHKMQELALLSAPFADFLNRRVVHYLDLSRQALASHYSSQALAEQSMETPLGRLVSRDPVACSPHASLSEALQKMTSSKVGAILVLNEGEELLGIFTERDVIQRVTLPQLTLDTKIEKVMQTPVFSLSEDDTAQEAAMLMSRHSIRHVPIMRGLRVIGMISERDLFAMQRLSLNSLSNSLQNASNLDELKHLADKIRAFAAKLLAQGVTARQTSALISHLNDLLTKRVITLEAEHHQVSMTEFCWIALGSEGRGEQTIATDQDNALILADHVLAAEQEHYRIFALAVNQALDTCGYPLCKGGIMGSNALWCLTEARWREKFLYWINQGGPEDLLNAHIFFDLRALAGDQSLAERLRDTVVEMASSNPRFVKQLAGTVLSPVPPINWLGALETTQIDGKPTIDLKLQGSAIFVAVARVYALANGLRICGTAERLEQVGPKLGAKSAEFSSWVTAFEFLQTLRLRTQLDAGNNPNHPNLLDVSTLNQIDKKILKVALGEARSLQQRLQMDYGQ
jgi:CBS domain-containing protein